MKKINSNENISFSTNVISTLCYKIEYLTKKNSISYSSFPIHFSFASKPVFFFFSQYLVLFIYFIYSTHISFLIPFFFLSRKRSKIFLLIKKTKQYHKKVHILSKIVEFQFKMRQLNFFFFFCQV